MDVSNQIMKIAFPIVLQVHLQFHRINSIIMNMGKCGSDVSNGHLMLLTNCNCICVYEMCEMSAGGSGRERDAYHQCNNNLINVSIGNRQWQSVISNNNSELVTLANELEVRMNGYLQRVMSDTIVQVLMIHIYTEQMNV